MSEDQVVQWQSATSLQRKPRGQEGSALEMSGYMRAASGRHIQNVLGQAPLGWHFPGICLVFQDITGETVSTMHKQQTLCQDTDEEHAARAHRGPGVGLCSPGWSAWSGLTLRIALPATSTAGKECKLAEVTRASCLHFRIS